MRLHSAALSDVRSFIRTPGSRDDNFSLIISDCKSDLHELSTAVPKRRTYEKKEHAQEKEEEEEENEYTE